MTSLSRVLRIGRFKWLLLGLILIASVGLAIVVSFSPTNKGWAMAERSENVQEIQNSKKLVYFYNPDCSDCRKMTPKIMAYNGMHKIRVVAVDTTKLTPREIRSLGLRVVPSVKTDRSGLVEINNLSDYVSHVRE